MTAGLVGGLVLVALYLWIRPPVWMLDLATAAYPEVLFRVDTSERVVALTIDDSPHPAVTPGLLDALARYRAHATFFILGENAARYPDLVERIRVEGHELANHLYTDQRSTSLSSREFEDQLLETGRLIGGGEPTRWCRPGSGTFSRRIVEQMLDHGYRPCLASAYPMDTYVPAPIAARHLKLNIRPGAILVLHDGKPGRERGVRTLEAVLEELRARKYGAVSVSALFALRNREG